MSDGITVYLDEFSDDEIRAEYEERGLGVYAPEIDADAPEPEVLTLARELFEAFHRGQHERAIGIARRFAQDVTGRVLVR